MDFKVSCGPVSLAEAKAAADELEKVIGEIANRQRKPQNIPMQPLIALIEFVRRTEE